MKFRYIAKKTDGSEYEETAEAPDRFALFREVKNKGDVVISVREEKQRAASLDLGRLLAFSRSVRMHEKIIFARNLGAMLEAGLSLSRALGVLGRQMRNPRLREIFTAVEQSIASGISFSESLEKFKSVFPPLFIAMVRAGEGSGKLAESLRVIAGQMEQSYLLKKKIRGALTYPTVILVAMIVIGFLMMTYVVPTLSSTFTSLNVDLPASTQAIIAVSDFLAERTLFALLLGVLAVVLSVVLLRTRPGRRAASAAVLRLPLIAGIVRETNAARMARTLSSLLASGVSMVEALDITRDVVQNAYFRAVLADARAAVTQGAPMSTVFRDAEHLYPPFVAEMVAVGEETGELSEMLIRVAVFYEDEVAQKTKDLSTVIEPLLMVVIGTAVGFFAISMISPIYSISSSI